MNFKTGAELVEEARQRISEISPKDTRALHESGNGVVFLDVREPNEWNLGRIPGAVHLPRGNLESKVEGLVARDKRVVVYCARANRSALAADTMQQMGYQNVASMSEGFGGWIAAGGDVEE
ncbi:MAG: sulfurtransferase [Gemmatimonadaceae bacterium]|nr:sulfurtransferase [Gemmatimonadaceae bacterium]